MVCIEPRTVNYQDQRFREVKDENESPLSNAKIVLHSTGFLYYSGASGAFGIITDSRFDSITVSLSGYHSLSMRVDASKYQQIRLHPLTDKGLAQFLEDYKNSLK